MKKLFLIITVVSALSLTLKAQNNIKIGGGYFGQTVTYPGFVLEYEKEEMHSEKASIPVRIDIGFYYHKRHSTGLFAEINYGFRRYFKSGLFLEESIGIGVMQTILSGDAVYEVGTDGTVSETSRLNKPDVMPSMTLGLGFDISKGKEKQTLVWFRPKIYWQFPERTSSVFTPAVQFGITHKIN